MAIVKCYLKKYEGQWYTVWLYDDGIKAAEHKSNYRNAKDRRRQILAIPNISLRNSRDDGWIKYYTGVYRPTSAMKLAIEGKI